MATPSRPKKFLIGMGFLLALLVIGFGLINFLAYNWGATPAEVDAVYPGDDLYPQPQIVWTHGVTYHATPEQVWPWIVQIGDTRAAFYSFTFIENLIDPADSYHNADRVVAEWQNPPIGQGMIVDAMRLYQIEPGHWMLANTQVPIPGFGMSWLWTLAPEGKNATRMVVRIRIGIPPEMNNPLIRGVIHVGGFVMEQGMLRGLAGRVEGRGVPAFFEAAGILLWLAALAIGLAAAWVYLRPAGTWHALAVGLAAVVALFILTFVQPVLWVRLALDALLLAALLWVARSPRPAELRKPSD